MNDNKNTYNLNEVKNKLENFQEGKDYFVTPTKVPEIKDYTFFSDRLKSLFGGNNWIPVRVWQEKYDDENVSYRGHFEKGKDYQYSAQSWIYGENYQGDRGTESLPDWMKDWKWDEHKEVEFRGGAEAGNAFSGNKYWEKSWTYRGKGKANKLGNSWEEEEKIEPNFEHDFFGNKVGFRDEERIKELEMKIDEWRQKLDYLESQPRSEKNELEIERFKKDIKDGENTIRTLESRSSKNDNFDSEPAGCCNCGKKIHHPSKVYWYDKKLGEKYALCSSSCKEEFVNDNGKSEKSDLEKENSELRQQLAAVQAELAKVLAELKKLTGKGGEKLEQQQAENEKAIKEGSMTEVKEQIAKSQALVQEASTKNTANPVNEPNKTGTLPYLVGGSLLVAGLGGVVFCWKRHNSKK